MFISQQCCKTQGLRKAYINSLTNDRHYNIKSLKKLDKDLARTYTNTKYYGGSLKTFWNKAKKFGKRILDSAVTVTKNMYKPAKWIIKTISTNDTVKGLVSKAADALGATLGVPGLGKMVTTAITAANNISDKMENIFEKIIEKNPNATKDEIKKLFEMTKEEIMNISNQTNLTTEQKKKVEEALAKIKPKDYINKLGEKITKGKVKDIGDKLDKVDLNKVRDTISEKVKKIMEKNPTVSRTEAEKLVKQVEGPAKEIGQTENSTEDVVDAIPDLIKSEGLEKVNASAGYLPYLNLSTVSSKERVGKGGRILAPTIRVTKPALILKNKDIFKKFGIPEWSAAKVGPVAGALKKLKISPKIATNEGCGIQEDKKESGRPYMGRGGDWQSPESEERKKIMARLRSRSGRAF